MRILVLSDSHGDVDSMIRWVETMRPDAVCYLGDGLADARELQSRFPALRFECVRGNCDAQADAPYVKIAEFDGVRAYLTHGANFTDEYAPCVVQTAREAGAQLLLYGHTHEPALWREDEILFMNPGSAKKKPGKRCSTCGLMETDGGRVRVKIRFSDHWF